MTGPRLTRFYKCPRGEMRGRNQTYALIMKFKNNKEKEIVLQTSREEEKVTYKEPHSYGPQNFQ